ncbi:MFS transporter [Brevibacillus sp. H7]|uniref:MFS transporter n=1 Tax=Brevibacillus sp. H7 TaxID=3349138 RepID=UPI003811171C
MRFRDFPRTIQIRIALQFLTQATTMMIVPFLAVYFSARVGETLTGIMFVAVILSGVAGGFCGGYFADRLGRKQLMIVAEIIAGVTYLLIAFANSPWFDSPYLTAGLFLINMFGIGLFGPAAQAMIIDVSSPENRKYIYGFMYWASNLAMAIGGMVGGFFFITHRFVFYLAVAAATLLSVFITALFIDESYRPSLRDPDSSATPPASGIFSSYSIVFHDRRFLLYLLGSLLLLSLEQQLSNYIGVRLGKEMTMQSLFSWPPGLPEVDGLAMLGILRTENTLLVAAGGYERRICQLLGHEWNVPCDWSSQSRVDPWFTAAAP